ncbi:Pentatricopeptide repeat [Dillenia turbinata]|uniref:Pentatricopeptide repeat n=1 Tax=Dillenia turbinata TaxID=194707 RepID=A0AAN8YUH4_9MAGN
MQSTITIPLILPSRVTISRPSNTTASTFAKFFGGFDGMFKVHIKAGCEIFEELLLILHAINLMSSPSKSVKAVATCLLYIVEGLFLNLLSPPSEVVAMPRGSLSIGKPSTIILRLLQHPSTFEVCYPLAVLDTCRLLLGPTAELMMERLYFWCMDSAHDNYTPTFQPVDESENDRLQFLTRMAHEACAALINYLPLEKQFKWSVGGSTLPQQWLGSTQFCVASVSGLRTRVINALSCPSLWNQNMTWALVFMEHWNLTSSSLIQTLEPSQTKPISNPLYNLLPETRNPNNIVDLICSNLKTKDSPLPFHDQVQHLLPYVSSCEVSRVLLRCQSYSLISLKFFNAIKNELNFSPSVENYCIIVHILVWSRQFSHAMKFLREPIEMNRPSGVFGNLVRCIDNWNWDPLVFDMLVKVYLKVGRIGDALKMYRKMVKIGFVPHVVTLNFLLNGHLKDGDVSRVDDFLEKMEVEGFDPDVVTYNTLIKGYCRKGRLDDAFYLYRIMYRRGVMPDVVTYTALMDGLCKAQKVREAHQLFHRMVDRGLSPDTVAYNSLISGYCNEGKMQESRSLMQEMIINGIYPDNLTCRVLVEGYIKENRLHSAMNLVAELSKLGVMISVDIYNCLITALCWENKPFAANNVMERMLLDGCLPRLETYNELIKSLCKMDFVAEALDLKAEVVHKDIKPNSVTYSALIGCLCRLGRTEEGESLMKEMVASGFPPDSSICRALVSGYREEGKVTDAESLLSIFAIEFHIYDTESYNILIKFYCEEGDVARSIELQDRMLKVGFVPNSLTFKYMIQGLRDNRGADVK